MDGEKKTPRKHIDFNYYRNHDNYYTRTQAYIDLAIKNAYTYNDFLKIMKDNKYEVVDRYGKLSVRNKNYSRRIRIERQFGYEYTIDNINNRIVEEVPDKLSQADLKELPDLKDLKIVGDDIDEKIINFLSQGYNPYYVRKGGVLIKVATISNGKSKTFQRICYELLEEKKNK